MVPPKKGKSECGKLCDKVKILRSVEKQHVFGKSWVVLWEKRIRHLQHRTELCASRA
jgi:hypothetical protein